MVGRVAATLVLTLAAAVPARVGHAADDGTFRYDLRLDGALTGAMGLTWAGLAIFQGAIAPSGCTWCEGNGLDATVRDGLRWDSAGTPNALSYATAVVGPAAVVGLGALSAGMEGRLRQTWAADGLIVAEAVVAAGLLNQIAKLIAERQRPYAHYGSSTGGGVDSHLSFYSGHTSLAFSFAVAGGTVASMRRYRLAPWIWGAGLAMAAATGYLRIAADKHYFTDVMTGALVGSGVGLAVPWLHRSPPGLEVRRVSLMVTPTGMGLFGLW